jgi:replication factor C subunit 3/5
MKICFIDEADHIPKPTQAALRKMIEDMSNNCRFLLAVNKRLKLEEALRSRLLPICFDIAAPHRAEVKEQLFRRYADVLARQGIKFTDTRLGELIGIYYPDLRSIANQVQFEFAYTDAY